MSLPLEIPSEEKEVPSPPPGTFDSPPSDACWWPKHHEEQWASKASTITRLTAWFILGIQALIILSSFFTKSLNIDILAIIGGFALMRGSQAWLRFLTFTSIFAACAIWWTLAPAIIFDHPVDFDSFSRKQSLTRDNIEFWAFGVSAAGVFTMEAVACVLCLRTRNLAFWTRKSRKWGGIALTLLAIGATLGGINSVRDAASQRRLEAKWKTELSAIRKELDSSPGTYSAEPVLRESQKIRLVHWRPLKKVSAADTLYSRDAMTYWSSTEASIDFPYQLPTGERGTIEIYTDGGPKKTSTP